LTVLAFTDIINQLFIVAVCGLQRVMIASYFLCLFSIFKTCVAGTKAWETEERERLECVCEERTSCVAGVEYVIARECVHFIDCGFFFCYLITLTNACTVNFFVSS